MLSAAISLPAGGLLRDVGVELAEVGVGAGRGGLQPAEPVDHGRGYRVPGDVEVLDRLVGLLAPEVSAHSAAGYQLSGRPSSPGRRCARAAAGSGRRHPRSARPSSASVRGRRRCPSEPVLDRADQVAELPAARLVGASRACAFRVVAAAIISSPTCASWPPLCSGTRHSEIVVPSSKATPRGRGEDPHVVLAAGRRRTTLLGIAPASAASALSRRPRRRSRSASAMLDPSEASPPARGCPPRPII